MMKTPTVGTAPYRAARGTSPNSPDSGMEEAAYGEDIKSNVKTFPYLQNRFLSIDGRCQNK
jgi:hypothetical protein